MSRTLSRVLRIGITVVVVVMLVLLARRVNWPETWAAFRSASLGVLILAMLVNLLSLVFKGVRWWVFLRPVGATSLWLAIRATFAGAGLNNVLVANGGEAARVVFVSRSAHVQSARVLATLALERLFELIGYVVVLALAAAIFRLPPALEETRPIALGALVVIAVFLVYLVRRPKLGAEVAEELPKPIGLMARARRYGGHFLDTLGGVSTGPRFAAALALSVLTWALQVATYQLTARAAHFPITRVETVAALLAVNVGFALKATPGNVGLFQFMYAATAAAFGLDKDKAVAVAFLIQMQQMIPVTILGIAAAPEFLLKRKKSRRATDRPGEIPSQSRGEDGAPAVERRRS